jgi:hypothetical protein
MPTSPKAGTNLRPELSQLVTTVLGDLAFMVADDEPHVVAPGTVWLQGEITYRGPVAGRLTAWCTRAFAVQLTANLLGTDPDSPEALVDAEDALRELLNVACGQLVTTWHGTTPIFHLGIPTVRECLDVPALERDNPHHCRLSVGDEPVLFRYQPEA